LSFGLRIPAAQEQVLRAGHRLWKMMIQTMKVYQLKMARYWRLVHRVRCKQLGTCLL
jgi:hypothetical protein